MTDPIHPASGDLEAVANHADNNADPVVSMLRDVNERLDREPPDVFGAKVSLHGARLAVSSRILSSPPATAASYLETVRLPLSATDDMIQSINAWSDDPSMDGGAIYDAILGHYAAPYSYAPATAAGVGGAVAWRWRRKGDPLWQFDGNREFPPVSPPSGYEQEPLYTTLASHDALIARDAEFEVWQDDMMVAGSSGPRDRALAEAKHYAAVYGQDGPVTVYEVTRTAITDLDARDGG